MPADLAACVYLGQNDAAKFMMVILTRIYSMGNSENGATRLRRVQVDDETPKWRREVA
jgi:hypothetical protein